MPAEFRGPGVHHNYEDSDSGYELDGENKGKGFGVGRSRGRIIFLGDGTEVLTDSDDTEMFDNADEDKDLESQVSKTSDGSPAAKPQTTVDASSGSELKSEGDRTPSKTGGEEQSSKAAHDGMKEDKPESPKDED